MAADEMEGIRRQVLRNLRDGVDSYDIRTKSLSLGHSPNEEGKRRSNPKSRNDIQDYDEGKYARDLRY